MDKTKEVLIEMLTERTGVALCDSGGSPKYDENGKYIGSDHGYGRNYEINRGREFEAEKQSTIKFEIYDGTPEISVEHNVFHWLASRLDYSEELDEMFHGEFLEDIDYEDDKTWGELTNEFPEWLSKQKDDDGDLIYGECQGIYGDGDPVVVNIYNHDNVIDQVIQFVYFETENKDAYIILQIHGGADVRGGYTKPRVFSDNGNSELAIFDYARASICCSHDNYHPTAEAIKEKQKSQLKLPGIYVPEIDFDEYHSWDTDDGCHWYEGGSCGAGYKQLEKYEAKDLEEDDVWERGKLCIKDGVGYCPLCGGRLESGF